ncbi:hypothetical protein ACFPIJ_09420 [Dactylosporangium cerinum]|uniref:MmpS family membrane protein n=1 Tax=Dactylosporangium cerinum TaxID=1434730 RepID=A0ABV9VNX8_9ACTN
MPRRLRSRLGWIAVLVVLPLLIFCACTPDLRRPVANTALRLFGVDAERSHRVEYWFAAPPNDTTGELKVTYTDEFGRANEVPVMSFAADWHVGITTLPGPAELRLSVTAATDLPADLRIRCWIAVDGNEAAAGSGLPCEARWSAG